MKEDEIQETGESLAKVRQALRTLADQMVKYYQEVEIKHGRVAMLAATGFLVGERFHPLFGGAIDVPSYLAFQQTPLQTFWPVVVAAIGFFEFKTAIPTFVPPGTMGENLWTLKPDHIPGNVFDPLAKAKQMSKKELKVMQTKEINNGRLAMLAIAGMVAQELVTGEKIFGPNF